MIKIIYGNFEEGIEEHLSTYNDIANWAYLSKSEDIFDKNVVYKNFGNPCEDYTTLLDGNSLPLLDDAVSKIGLWSAFPSNSDKQLGTKEAELPTIDIISDEVISTNAIGLEFDKQNNIYPTEAWIDIYRYNSEFSRWDMIDSAQIKPNNPVYFFKKIMVGFDRIKITFTKLNTPLVRLKVRSIKIGFQSEILGNRIKSLRVSQKINPISTNLPISSGEFSITNTGEIEESFALREIMKVYNNDTLVGKFFISEAKKLNKNQWNIRAVDYISWLDTNDFKGGVYIDKNAAELLAEIFETANVPFTISEGLKEKSVSGYIPYSKCRDALQQVLIAIGAYVRTAYSEKVDVLAIPDTISAEIPPEQIYIGQSIDCEAELTELEIYEHKYEEIEEEQSIFKSESATNSIKIIFNEPFHHLRIVNGEILESGNNYAIVDCQAGCELFGKKYKHTEVAKTIRKEENFISNNSKSIKDATLICSNNIDNVLNMCYNYLRRYNTVKSKVVEKGNIINVGNNYSVDTEMLGMVTGTLIEQSFDLFGGKVVKNTVIR